MRYFYLFAFCLITFSTSSQNYLRYYELTDSAFYYWKVHKTKKADSLYNLAFTKNIGFPNDYANAAYNIWSNNPQKGKTYIEKAFQYGAFLKDIEYFLEKNGIQISSKELKTIAKRNKEIIKSKRKKRIIKRIFRRDQMARIVFHKKMRKVDSLNLLKLIDFVNNDSLVFNRFYVGNKASVMTQPLLFHQMWDGIEPIREDLVRYVKKGWLHREFLWYAVEREAVFGGRMFKVEKDKVVVDKNAKNRLIAKRGYYSVLGQISFYNDSLKKQVLVPLNPQITDQEIDILRRSVFLGPLNIYRKSSGKINPDVDMFKKYFNL